MVHPADSVMVRLTVPAAREQDVRPHLHRVHPQRRVSTTLLHRVAPLGCNSLVVCYAPCTRRRQLG